MQKKIIALAIAGLASSVAIADSNVTIYGRMDVGVVSRSGDGGRVNTQGTLTSIDSGVQSGSRLGFRGAEDLGNGLKAIFEIEANLQADSQSNVSLSAGGLSSRHAYVGLTGGFGTAVAGRLDGARYSFAGKYNAFGLGTVGQFANLQVHQTRADNAIAYISPTWSGFSVLAAYSNNLTGTDGATAGSQSTTGAGLNKSALSDKTHLWAIAPQYNNGPISVTYDHEEADVFNLNNSTIKIDVLGASYDFGVVKVLGYWEKVRHDNRAVWDVSSWTLGATAPFLGKGTAKISYGRQQDKNDGTGAIGLGDFSKISIGADWALSKRTNLFVDAARINNKSGNGCGQIAVSGYTNSLDSGNQIGCGAAGNGTGFGVRGFDLGIAHTF